MLHTVAKNMELGSLTERFKIMLSILSDLMKFKSHKKIVIIKSLLNEVSVWVYWTCNRICVLDFDLHNYQGCTGIEPVLLSSAEGLKQSAVTTWPWRHLSNRNNGKYIDRRSDGVTTSQEITNKQQKLKYQLYIYSSSLKKYKTII